MFAKVGSPSKIGTICTPRITKKNNFLQKASLNQRYYKGHEGFPGGAVVKNPPPNAGDTGSSPGPGGSHMPRSN